MRLPWILRPLPWAVAAWAVYWCLLFLATHLPSLPQAVVDAPQHADKVVHLVGYAGLAFLTAMVVCRRHRWSPRLTLTLLAGLMTYGVIDELMQMPIPGRHASVADWIFDSIGAAIGLAAFRMVQKNFALRREGRLRLAQPAYADFDGRADW